VCDNRPVPKSVDHEGRRIELAGALWRVAARDGLQAATVRSVAAESGWSSGALRHYFPSKSDMLLFAVDHTIGEVRRRIGRLDASGHGLAPLRSVLEELLPLDEPRRVESEAWFTLAVRAQTDADLRERRREVDGLIRSTVHGVVRRLAQIGSLSPDRDLEVETLRLHALLDGLVVQGIARPPVLTPAEIRAVLAAHLAELSR
jgi:AcrR family transcriptional regulator